MLKELDTENFDNETKSGLKLIEFYTTWCGYCKKQQVELDLMDKIWIGQVDAEKCPDIASSYGIASFPTFIILKNGEEAERFSGYRKKEDIMLRIMAHL